jgi:PPOX class probable F420-dependent enzyme
VGAINLPGWARELVAAAPVGHLGLIDDAGRPRVLPIAFALIGDSVWSAVDEKPKRVARDELARVRWLRERPEATLLVDRYSDDWGELAWVQLLGRAAVLEGVEAPRELIARYQPYGRRPPSGPLIRIDIERVVSWRASG